MYFEAQTGLIRNAKTVFSNYAQYELTDTPGNRAWLEAGIRRAKLGPGGFEYDQSFIAPAATISSRAGQPSGNSP